MAHSDVTMVPAYQELPVPAKQIRLLSLQPGSRDKPIVCKTSVAVLAERPLYTALSYCWGKEQEPYEHKITFNGIASFGVTKNLFDALKHLRKEGELTDEPTTLWIDALCINQKDDNEKNLQVKLMGNIYKTATETCIWLGAATDDSDKAMDAITALDGDDLDSPRNMVDAATLKAIERLQQRPWWKRVWVIQEALLSKVPIVRCGDKLLTVRDFIRLDNIRRSWNDGNGSYVKTKNPISEASNALKNPFCGILAFWDLSIKQLEAGESTLAEWAYYLGDFDATNPKDKIYGLLGLGSDDDRRILQVAYDKEFKVNALYTRTATWFLQTGRDLIDFQFDQDNKAKKLTVNGEDLLLPTWVPDFSMSSPRPGDDTWFRPLYSPLTGDFRAFGDEKLLSRRIQPPNPFPPGEALAAVHLRGLVVDEVKFASGCDHMKPYADIDPEKRMAYRIERLRASVQKIEEWEKEANKPGLTTPYGTGKALKDAFLLTLMVNRAMSWSKLESDTDEDCHRMFEILMNREKTLQADGSQPEMTPDKDDAAKLQSLKSFIHAVVAYTTGRSFIITSKGYFGLAPLSTESGDIVCVLEGGAVPFVLRKVLATELAEYKIVPTEKQVYCNLIGESYVHGVSNGNWVDQRTEDEIREFIVA